MAFINGTNDRDDGLSRVAFRGGIAADTIDLIGGSDVLFGNAGDDTLLGGDDRDSFISGIGSTTDPVLDLAEIDFATYDGADLYDGGAGTDSLLVSYAPVVDGASPLVTIDLGSGTGRGGSLEGDRYQSIENVNFRDGGVGRLGRAKLIGSSAAETLFGGTGDDIVEGRGGGDRLGGGDSGLIFAGEAGFDTLSYASSPAGVTVDLGTNFQVSSGDASGDEILLGSFDAVIGSGFVDRITGTPGADRLDGGGANDQLVGRDGDDTYVFSSGRDTIFDTGGIDRIEALSLPGSTARIGNDLLLDFRTKGQIVVSNHFGRSAGSVGNAVETLVVPGTGQSLVLAKSGTGGAGSGIITGADEDETLDGEGGDDLVFGNGGADTVIGGEGDDILSGGKGPDVFLIRPGDGNDVIKDFTIRGKNADKLDLSAFGFETADDVLANLTRVDGKIVLTLGDDQTITFERLGGKLGLANLVLEAEA